MTFQRSSAAAMGTALACALASPARAHCPVQYQLSGPGGLFYEVDLGGNHFLGALPGGTTMQLGPAITWTDLRELDVTGGTMPVTMSVTDLTGTISCPEVDVSLDGPPQCGDDAPPIGYPACTPGFTVTQTGPHSFACASTCLSYPQPRAVPVTFTPRTVAAPPPFLLAPSSAAAGGPSFGLALAGTGFAPTSLAQWNGTGLTTLFVDSSTLLAAVPASLIAGAGLDAVDVLNTGGASPAVDFQVFPTGAHVAPSAQGLGGVRVYPNPWKASLAGAVTFDTLPPGSTIRIFTASGRLVRTLDAPAGAAQWDLTNGSGRAVASGYYLYLIRDGQGDRAHGTLALIR